MPSISSNSLGAMSYQASHGVNSYGANSGLIGFSYPNSNSGYSYSSPSSSSSKSEPNYALISSLLNSGVNLVNGVLSGVGAGYNVAFNQEQFEYQKDLQNRLINMELNAMQNKVKDYSAAGFSPLAALEGSAGNQIGAVANTASYQDVGRLLSDIGSNLSNSVLASQRLGLDREIAADSTRLQSLSISTNEYIAEMQNNTALKSIYNSNKQFYDNLSFVFEQNRLRLEHEIKLEHDRLDSAESIKKMEIASNELIASSERALKDSLAKMQDERAADLIMKNYEIACKQLYQAVQEAKKQRDWQSAENAWNRLTSFGTSVLNNATQLLGGFINPLGQAFAGNKGYHSMGDSFGFGQQILPTNFPF